MVTAATLQHRRHCRYHYTPHTHGKRRLADAAPQGTPSSQYNDRWEVMRMGSDADGAQHRQPHHCEHVPEQVRATQHDAPPTSEECHETEDAGQHVNSLNMNNNRRRQAAQQAHAPPAFDSSAMALLPQTTVVTRGDAPIVHFLHVNTTHLSWMTVCAKMAPPCIATPVKRPPPIVCSIARTEHNNATVPGVSDDELVKGRARDAGGAAELADTHVADELALHAEHAHAVVATVGDCDVTVPGHEAQSKRLLQLTVAAAL
jgi:hypothetical protein